MQIQSRIAGCALFCRKSREHSMICHDQSTVLNIDKMISFQEIACWGPELLHGGAEGHGLGLASPKERALLKVFDGTLHVITYLKLP